MILCLEDASAVGKTTTCQAMIERMEAVGVVEANALFSRSHSETENWYLERQVKRWRLARNAEAGNSLVVPDGDSLQPLLYNWSYGFQGRQKLDALQEFYRPQIVSGRLQFPKRYFF